MSLGPWASPIHLPAWPFPIFIHARARGCAHRRADMRVGFRGGLGSIRASFSHRFAGLGVGGALGLLRRAPRAGLRAGLRFAKTQASLRIHGEGVRLVCCVR